jgi:Flp pilus assembly pilin Flp
VRRLRDERGSAVAEFAMVSGLLVLLVLAVVQFTVAVLVRNTLHDAAAQGARVAALADASLGDGAERTAQLIGAALGPGYARQVSARYTTEGGIRVVAVTVRSPLPVIGLVGFTGALEVTGHAALAAG